jgi:hypothetical protein
MEAIWKSAERLKPRREPHRFGKVDPGSTMSVLKLIIYAWNPTLFIKAATFTTQRHITYRVQFLGVCIIRCHI